MKSRHCSCTLRSGNKRLDCRWLIACCRMLGKSKTWNEWWLLACIWVIKGKTLVHLDYYCTKDDFPITGTVIVPYGTVTVWGGLIRIRVRPRDITFEIRQPLQQIHDNTHDCGIIRIVLHCSPSNCNSEADDHVRIIFRLKLVSHCFLSSEEPANESIEICGYWCQPGRSCLSRCIPWQEGPRKRFKGCDTTSIWCRVCQDDDNRVRPSGI